MISVTIWATFYFSFHALNFSYVLNSPIKNEPSNPWAPPSTPTEAEPQILALLALRLAVWPQLYCIISRFDNKLGLPSFLMDIAEGCLAIIGTTRAGWSNHIGYDWAETGTKRCVCRDACVDKRTALPVIKV